MSADRRWPSGLPGLAWATCAVGAVVTASVAWSSHLVFGIRSFELHLVFDTADACVALLLAHLLFGRHARLRRLQDLALAHGLLILAVAGLGLTLLLDVLLGLGEAPVGAWLPLTLRVVSAVCVLVAALLGSRPGRPVTHRMLGVLPWATLACSVLLLWLARDELPAALDTTVELQATYPAITGHPMLLLAQAVSAGCFFAAAVLFLRQAREHDDVLLRWLGPACVLGGFARVNYVLFPSIYSDWIYTGDVLRTGFYLLLLVGAIREIDQHWGAQSRLAVLEDRRRLARELHDGVVQELTYIRSATSVLAAAPAEIERILDACDRALDESREAVHALASTSEEPLGHALHRAARDVVERYGGRIVVDVDTDVHVDRPQQQHALTRITREAVSNALRHGAARSVRLRLERDTARRRLVLEDDGTGFDVQARERAGYGLTSMRERAHALPGSFTLSSQPGEGTRVLVEW